MEVYQIAKEDVEIFFNKYKYNSELIVHLERRLLDESYDFEKWHEMLADNSHLTRRLFAENEQLLDMYIRPVMKNPDLLRPETADYYLLHVLFFLFENHVDSFITSEFTLKLRSCSRFMTQKGKFDSSFDLALSHIAGNSAEPAVNDSFFREALSCYPDASGDSSSATQIHLVFIRLFRLLNCDLDDKPDISMLVDTVKEACAFLDSPATAAVYAKMWSPDADFSFHTALLKRFIRIYAVYGAGRSSFCTVSGEKNIPPEAAEWLTGEYEAETSEKRINCMIYTYYWKMKYCRGEIDRGEYQQMLSRKYREERVNIPLMKYSENSFPLDDDPVSPRFADLLDTMKLFCTPFTFMFILMQELFALTSDDQIREFIVHDTELCYSRMPYAAEGFSIDKIIVENVKLILPWFTTEQDCFKFLQSVFVHRQITTAIHFTMVSRLAVLCTKHFLAERPEMFIGLPGIHTAADVSEKSGEIESFMKSAGLCHDLGKLYCTNLVNLHSRKITADEFMEIRRHAEQGAQIAESVPLLAGYADIMRGHHKSWDGKSGYPEDYDNTKSPVRILTDIIAVCDSIDAATDILGRNYAAGKTFAEMLAELKEGAGTRYNPDVVSLIAGDSGLVSAITKMTGEDRAQAYYEIYCQFVGPNITFAPEDERTISIYTAGDEKCLEDFYHRCFPDETYDRIRAHIGETVSAAGSRIYLLCSRKKEIFGLLSGRRQTRLGEEDMFFCDELLIRPDSRRRGYATQLMSFMESDMQKSGCGKIAADVMKDFHRESFFWINGFTDTPCCRMVKTTGIVP